jgi:hypothetical protein
MRHVNVGVTCQTCHGQIQKMDRVYQAESLNMGWCVKCHVGGYTQQQGLVAAGYASADGPSATLAGVPQTSASPAPTDSVRKARFDCANCHY